MEIRILCRKAERLVALGEGENDHRGSVGEYKRNTLSGLCRGGGIDLRTL